MAPPTPTALRYCLRYCSLCLQSDRAVRAVARYTGPAGTFDSCQPCADHITRLQATFPREFTAPTLLPESSAA